MQDTSDKLLSAERQLQAEAEAKKVLIAQQKKMKEDCDRQLQEANKKLQASEAEAKSRLIDQQKSLQDTSAQLAQT